MMNLALFLNNPKPCIPIAEHDFIIGVDGGCRHCFENQLDIHLAIGDFDSLSQTEIEKLKILDVTTESYNADKDMSDLELAINAANARHPDVITAYGVWGGRVDHSLANLFCLAKQTLNVPIILPGPQQHGYLIKNNQKIIIQSGCNHLVSILAMGADCKGVSNTGFKYPLQSANLEVGTGLGLSNLTINPHSEIWLDHGCLLVLIDHGASVALAKNDKQIYAQKPLL